MIKLNKSLLKKQNIDAAGEKLILELHDDRLAIEKLMNLTDTPEILKFLNKEYTEIEFALQDAWGFPRNANMHRFWNRPKCTCPRLDNEDAYGTKYSITSGDCPLHGE